jgi:hypothetical protein
MQWGACSLHCAASTTVERHGWWGWCHHAAPCSSQLHVGSMWYCTHPPPVHRQPPVLPLAVARHNINTPGGGASFRQAEMTAIRRGNTPGRFTTNLLAGRNKPKTDEDTGGTGAIDKWLWALACRAHVRTRSGIRVH